MIWIVYCIFFFYIFGGVERVLIIKVNYLVENGNYDIYILLIDGKGKFFCYILLFKVKII